MEKKKSILSEMSISQFYYNYYMMKIDNEIHAPVIRDVDIAFFKAFERARKEGKELILYKGKSKQ